MATLVNKTVKSVGGDYSSLSAWEAGQQGNLPVLDQIQQATVFPFVDTTVFTIDGWTTDATRYISIIADSTAYSNGYFDSTKYYLAAQPGSGTAIITNLEAFVRIDGIQMQLTMVTESGTNCIKVGDLGTTGDVRIGHCLFKGIVAGGNGSASAVAGADANNGQCQVTIYDSVAFEFYDVSFPNSNVAAGFANSFSNMKMYNCTTFNCNTGYFVAGTTFKSTAVNCLGYNNAVNSNYLDFSASTRFQNSSNNASTDASAPGTSALTSQTSGNINFISIASANSNFLDVNSGSTVLSAGTNDPLSGIYSDDIRLRTRTGTWSIGANQPTSGGGGGSTPGNSTQFLMLLGLGT